MKLLLIYSEINYGIQVILQLGICYYLCMTKLSLEEVVSVIQYHLLGDRNIQRQGNNGISRPACCSPGWACYCLTQSWSVLHMALTGAHLSDSLVSNGLLRLSQKRWGSFHLDLLEHLLSSHSLSGNTLLEPGCPTMRPQPTRRDLM